MPKIYNVCEECKDDVDTYKQKVKEVINNIELSNLIRQNKGACLIEEEIKNKMLKDLGIDKK